LTADGETGPKFISGREEILRFLQRKWAKELNYRLIKEL
jgi:nuclear transport factor 2 (NTF2) superfamily protein